MHSVQRYLDKKQESIKFHPFFNKLSKKGDFSEGMAFVPRLAFWVMVFQDILRIIPLKIETPHLRRIATHHKHEDMGHDKWFFEDLSYLGKNHIITVEWLFSPDHQITRDITYHIVSEAFYGKDFQKIILILALESTGHVFFENIAKFAKSKGRDANLKYLSSYHLDVEMNHRVFEEKLKEDLYSLVLSEEERCNSIAMIDRVYESFNTLFDYLLDGLADNAIIEEIDELPSRVA